MSLDDFLAGEQAGGQTVSEDATFTLNPDQVRSRVATFCEEERLYPFYRCLQAAVRLSQSDLFLRYGSDAWTASFAWNEAPEAKLFQSFLLEGVSQGFDHISHVATQHLFFGISAALGQPHYRLEWVSPQGGFVVSGGKLELSDKQHPEFCQISFAIESSWWQRLSSGNRQRAETERQLRHRLCYSPVPIHLEGERLKAVVPVPPDRPWASRLVEGSNLAWRYLQASSGGLLRPPDVPLDHYRGGRKGKIWHLIKDDPASPLPLSIQFTEAQETTPPALGSSRQPHDKTLCRSALFLSLQAGRQDWLFPVRDGVLGEPMPINISRGGVLVVSADEELRYDLFGLRVVNDSRLESKIEQWSKEAKTLKSELRVSVANSTLRAENMPSQYYQASGYAFGGPMMGVLAGKVGPAIQRFFSPTGKAGRSE